MVITEWDLFVKCGKEWLYVLVTILLELIFAVLLSLPEVVCFYMQKEKLALAEFCILN